MVNYLFFKLVERSLLKTPTHSRSLLGKALTMTALVEMYEEVDHVYDYQLRTSATQAKERRRVKSMRQMSGQERASQHARYSRRSSPTRQSGAHRRGNKRYGV